MDISWILSFFVDPKYWVLFLLFLVEGPIVNFIAALVAVTGILNIWYVFSLAVLGSVIGDTLHYFFGSQIAQITFRDKFKKIENKTLFEKLRKLLDQHFYKALLVIKTIPAFSSIGLLYLGKERYSFKKFILGSIIFSIILDGIISFLGYSVVGSIAKFIYYFNIYQKAGIILGLILILGFVIWYFKSNIKTFFYKLIFSNRDKHENTDNL